MGALYLERTQEQNISMSLYSISAVHITLHDQTSHAVQIHTMCSHLFQDSNTVPLL